MKKIDLPEQKKLLIELLKYITDICQENDIKYSLLGGSLIGAVRHEGIIPWDDDVDIVLMPDEYQKLIKVLSEKNHAYYFLMNPETNKDYYYPFAKLIDTRTTLIENGIKTIPNYGVYLDIFVYHYVSKNEFIRKMHYKRLFFIQTLFARAMLNPKEMQRLKTKIIVTIANIFGPNYFKRRHMKICRSKHKTEYILMNWPAYGYKKEIQNVASYQKYKYVKFENIKAMITEDYDTILKTTFGNYMQLPPKEKRVAKHDTQIYWR